MKNITKFEKVSFTQFLNDAKNFNQNDMMIIYNDINLPKRATKASAGYDFYMPFDVELKPNESIIIPTGIKCQMNEDLVLIIVPRSSLGFKYRLQLDNTIGIIDSDYYNNSQNEGHIKIKLSNLSLDNKTLILNKGTSFAQGIFLTYSKTIDDDVKEARRGGFGSTNQN